MKKYIPENMVKVKKNHTRYFLRLLIALAGKTGDSITKSR